MTLVFATNNPNKLNEVKAQLPKSITVLGLADIGCFEDIPETQPTIAGNAKQKANYVSTNYGYNCFADDTGLEIESLNGAPGVNSARYAGAQRSATANMEKVLAELKNQHNRNAQFKTVIALQLNNEHYEFTGICQGEITKQPQGDKGFGYDPIFKPNGYTETFAQLSLAQKTTISHRGKAVKQLISFINTYKSNK